MNKEQTFSNERFKPLLKEESEKAIKTLEEEQLQRQINFTERLSFGISKVNTIIIKDLKV